MSNDSLKKTQRELLKVQKDLNNSKLLYNIAKNNHRIATNRELKEDDPDLPLLSHNDTIRYNNTQNYLDRKYDIFWKTYKKYVNLNKKIKLLEENKLKNLPPKPSSIDKKHSSKKGGKRTKKRVVLPKLRPINNKNVKYKYKIKDPQSKRILAINEGIRDEVKKTGKTLKKAAMSKKRRFNILRIYRKNKRPKECKRITDDMKYIDKKYGLGKTTNICI